MHCFAEVEHGGAKRASAHTLSGLSRSTCFQAGGAAANARNWTRRDEPPTMPRRMASLSALHLRPLLALVVLASGCGPAPAPAAAPDETPELTSASPAAPESPAAEPPAVETGTPEPAPAPSAPAPSSAAAAPQDTRGKAEIQQVMAENRDKVRACYEAVLPNNPGSKGDLVVDFTIDPRGEVKQAEVNWSASDLHIPELDTCAVDVVKAIKFPASSRGLESKVTYPFNFNPPRPGKPAPRTESAGPSR